MNALSPDTIHDAMKQLPGWRYEGDALHKRFERGSFRAALAFLVRVGFEAEQRNHHPEIVNVYGKVELTLRTHDAGNKVTSLDLELAKAIEALA